LIGQLCSLERRTARGGHDTIDHAPSSHDDVANCVAGVLTQIISDRRPALVRQSDLLNSEGDALPLPKVCQFIVAVLAVGVDGSSVTLFAAICQSGPRLLLLDFEVGHLRHGIFDKILERTHALIVQCRAQNASIFVPKELHRHAIAVDGLESAQAIPDEIVPEESLISASAHIAANRVRLCAPIIEKSANTPFAGALDIRAFENADDPLRKAAIVMIAIALDIN